VRVDDADVAGMQPPAAPEISERSGSPR
jgi:hypothetical protein